MSDARPGLLAKAAPAALARLPAALGRAWSAGAHAPLDATDVPEALAALHRVLEVGAEVGLSLVVGSGRSGTDDAGGNGLGGGDLGRGEPSGDGRVGQGAAGNGSQRTCAKVWSQRLVDVVAGAGFELAGLVELPAPGGRELSARAVRARTLADRVGSRLRVLLCGLNPSLYAADAGVGFARPGNRFWPAALAAGLLTHDRDPSWALQVDRVGMTDLVKRATVGAEELRAEEYRAGVHRVERLVAWLRPTVVCVVGLTGWRAAVDRRAGPGLQPDRLAGRPVYVMPNTSGLNAHASLAQLTDHLRSVRTLSDAGRAAAAWG